MVILTMGPLSELSVINPESCMSKWHKHLQKGAMTLFRDTVPIVAYVAA